jgi:hypothetical protein
MAFSDPPSLFVASERPPPSRTRIRRVPLGATRLSLILPPRHHVASRSAPLISRHLAASRGIVFHVASKGASRSISRHRAAKSPLPLRLLRLAAGTGVRHRAGESLGLKLDYSDKGTKEQ